MRRAFTLLEVNLAILVMAVGILGMCGLYSLGFQENRQSKEDVAASALAGADLAPLVQALSSREMTWTQWKSLGKKISQEDSRKMGGVSGILPDNGWGDYVTVSHNRYKVKDGARGKAKTVFGQVASASGVAIAEPDIPDVYDYGLVLTRCGARIQLAFRLTNRRDMLMAQPVFVSEVHFQGDPNQ